MIGQCAHQIWNRLIYSPVKHLCRFGQPANTDEKALLNC